MAQPFESNHERRSVTEARISQSSASQSGRDESAEDEEREPSVGRPNEHLAKVFESREESEAMVVRGLLESAGIETFMTSPEAPQDILPGIGGTIIFVREEHAEESREIIAACQVDESGNLADQAE